MDDVMEFVAELKALGELWRKETEKPDTWGKASFRRCAQDLERLIERWESEEQRR